MIKVSRYVVWPVLLLAYYEKRSSLPNLLLLLRWGICPFCQAMPLKVDDPMQFYTDMRKLGQGASGTVFVGTDLRTGEVRRVSPGAEVQVFGCTILPA